MLFSASGRPFPEHPEPSAKRGLERGEIAAVVGRSLATRPHQPDAKNGSAEEQRLDEVLRTNSRGDSGRTHD